MKKTHFILAAACSLATGISFAQNTTVKQTVSNAANNAVQNAVTNVMSGKSPIATASLGTISKSLDNGLTFTVTGCLGDPVSQRVTLYFTISNPSKPNQSVTIRDFWGSEHPMTALDGNSKIYQCTETKLSEQRSENQELPTGLSIRGTAVYTNVLSSVSSFAIMNIYEKSSNWDDGGDKKDGMIELRNIPINWSQPQTVITPISNDPQNTPISQQSNLIKNIDNGISFAITGCVGDSVGQRVTLYFTFSNPSKPNQQIQIADPYNNSGVTAMDAYSKPYNAARITLADKHGEGTYALATAELPTGLELNGSVTFNNILPSLRRFALINIFVKNANFDGGGDQSSGFIEIRNVAIIWQKKTIMLVKPVKKTAGA